MAFPPGQGKSGEYLMHLWRQYLELCAEHEGKLEEQIVVAAYSAAEVFGWLSKMLDREGGHEALIAERIANFEEGKRQAKVFGDCLVNATFSLYNHCNTLAHQFTPGNSEAEELVRQIDDQLRVRIQGASQIERSAAAMRACFPLLSIVTMVLEPAEASVNAVRQVEQRFVAGGARAATTEEHLLNSLYRTVEMLQLTVTLSDPDLRDDALHIAARFQEEDESREVLPKLRNGFCRLFELGHLLTTHLDDVLN